MKPARKQYTVAECNVNPNRPKTRKQISLKRQQKSQYTQKRLHVVKKDLTKIKKEIENRMRLKTGFCDETDAWRGIDEKFQGPISISASASQGRAADAEPSKEVKSHWDYRKKY